MLASKVSRLRVKSALRAVESVETTITAYPSSATFSSRTTSITPHILASLQGPPSTTPLIAPGNCQFTAVFQPSTLVDRQAISSSSSILRFALPDSSKPLQLSTCACVLAGAMIDGTHVVRPYTPISTNDLVGYVDFLIKDYGEHFGTMSRFLHQIEIGSDVISFQHIAPNVKIQAPFSHKKHVVMLAGGTGITPMLQALHSILGGSPPNTTTEASPRVTLLYGSQTMQDILGQSLLDQWAEDYRDRFSLVHVLSDEPSLSSWNGRRGFLDAELLAEYLPSSSLSSSASDRDSDVLILVCGPPPMYEALCGPRQETKLVSGILGQMGFTSKEVYKF